MEMPLSENNLDLSGLLYCAVVKMNESEPISMNLNLSPAKVTNRVTALAAVLLNNETRSRSTLSLMKINQDLLRQSTTKNAD